MNNVTRLEIAKFVRRIQKHFSCKARQTLTLSKKFLRIIVVSYKFVLKFDKILNRILVVSTLLQCCFNARFGQSKFGQQIQNRFSFTWQSIIDHF